MRQLSIALVAIVLSSQVATAQQDLFTVGAMVPGCRALVKPPATTSLFEAERAGVCSGIIQGIAFMGGTMNKEVNDSIRFCLPDKLKVRALLEAVIEYLDANNIPPSAPFKEEVVLALRKIWPCKG